MKFSEYKIFKVKVTDVSRDEWRNYLYDRFHHKKYARIIILTEKKFFHALFNRELLETINQAEVVLCASSLVSWFSYHMYGKVIKPALAVTYVLDALSVASECQSMVSFYGSTKNILFMTVKKVSKSFQGIRIVSAYPEKIALKEMGKVFIAIRKTAANLGLFNLGNDKYQELWINKNFALFKNGVVIGCDDSFEIIAGRKSVPPLSMQDKGMLGLYEILTHPFNIAKMFRFCVLIMMYLWYLVTGQQKKLGNNRS